VDRKTILKGGSLQPLRLFTQEQNPYQATLPFDRRFPLQKSVPSRLVRLRNLTLTRQQVKEKAALAARTAAPIALALAMSSIAHAQGTVDFSGATTVMNSFKTFAEYAGAVICLGSLIFAGIRLMSGRFQDAIPGLFGALFGAGVLGWGAGWISSLTGQSVSQ
jgi:hypothetical protein